MVKDLLGCVPFWMVVVVYKINESRCYILIVAVHVDIVLKDAFLSSPSSNVGNKEEHSARVP